MSFVLPGRHLDAKTTIVCKVFGVIVIMLIREAVSLVRLLFKCTQTLRPDQYQIRVAGILFHEQV